MTNQNTKPPNIIWIMADDLSWGDLGCFGQEKIKTPHIDKLAREGMKFTQCYSGSTVCAPSRSSLMQGLHQGHATVRENMVRTVEGNVYRHSLQPDDVTVAQVARQAGYGTGLFGKWGLALSDQPGLPNDMGFDTFFGYLNQRRAHNYSPEYLWNNREKAWFPGNRGHNIRKPNEYDAEGRITPNGVDDPAKTVYAFDAYAEESLKFVRTHRDRPFFLYLAYTLPHGGYEVPDLGEYAQLEWPTEAHKILAAMVSRIDREVGRLTALLEDLGIDGNTLIFFVSDNGYSVESARAMGQEYPIEPSFDSFFRHRGPWKGKKSDLNQGGLRVPAIARWPGKIEAGSTKDLVWGFWDFLPTVADILGIAPPSPTDGVSVLPTLLGDPGQEQHDYLYWEYRDEQSARMENWYLHRQHPDTPIEIFDAVKDPGQEKDLAGDYPDIVKRGKELFRDARTEVLHYPNPGEPLESWSKRLRKAGISLPDNAGL